MAGMNKDRGILGWLALCLGFFLFLGSFLFAFPFVLKHTEEPIKADILILEAKSSYTQASLQVIAKEFSKGSLGSILILVPKSDPVRDELGEVGGLPVRLITENLLDLGIPRSKISALNLDKTDSDHSYKSILQLNRFLISKGYASAAVFSEDWQSQRHYLLYKKQLNALGMNAFVLSYPTEMTSTNWYLQEKGVSKVMSEIGIFIYYFIKGYI
jgi:hypothetical protein